MDQSIVAQWNEVTLEAIRSGAAKPTATTYELYIVSTAIYDAWAAYSDEAYGRYSEIVPTGPTTQAAKAEAVSYAAYGALKTMFPQTENQQRFDDFMTGLGYDVTVTSTNTATAAGVGNLAVANVLAARADDGSNFANDYADTSGYTPVNSADPEADNAPGGVSFDPNHWQPLRVATGTVLDANGIPVIDPNDPNSFVVQSALTPHWGSVDSFNLTSGDQFRPIAPPLLGDMTPYTDGLGVTTTNDQAYRDQVAEVMEASATLTAEEKVIAEFWADGPRTESPPGHWNQIAQDVALRDGHGIDDDAKMFFALNAALLDAGVATWEAKYHYDYLRPQTAIHNLYFDQMVEAWGGPNLGTQDILGQDWRPYQNVTFVTPPFPEFVSGHSTFSMVAANTIAAYVGSDQLYDGTTLGNYDLNGDGEIDLLGQYVTSELTFEDYPTGEAPTVLQWETLTEAAIEAGASRIYGGIHIQDGNLRGLEMGGDIALNAEIRWEAMFTRGGDDVLTADAAGGLLIAGAGADTVNGSWAADVLEMGSGHDKAYGGAGDDALLGGTGSDRLFGGFGDDRIEGGGGWDRLSGSRGADDFVLNPTTNAYDLVSDFQRGGDVIVLNSFARDAYIELVQAGAHVDILVADQKTAVLMNTDLEDVYYGVHIQFEDSVL